MTAFAKREWVKVPFEEPKAESPKAADATTQPDGQGPLYVFIGVPSYDGWVKLQAFEGLVLASERFTRKVIPSFGSLLGQVFNDSWSTALNSRDQVPWNRYAMHHSDIAAPPGWLDVLEEERVRVGVDVISCAVAIKDQRRLSSSGVLEKDGSIRRLTLKEIYRLPETFTTADLPSIGIDRPLVVNTGLWLCDFPAGGWIEAGTFPGFNVCTRIDRGPDGRARPLLLPEDWGVSEWWNRNGIKIACTRKILVHHFGEADFTNELPEDGWDFDLGDDPARYKEVRAARAARVMEVAK